MSEDSAIEVKAEPPVPCPHCGKELAFEYVARFHDKYILGVELTPHEGSLIAADALATSMGATAKILVEIAKGLGAHAVVMVKSIQMKPNGAIHYQLLVARGEKEAPKRKKIKETTLGFASPRPGTGA